MANSTRPDGLIVDPPHVHDLLDEIEAIAGACEGSIQNPRYFARMLADTLAANLNDRRVALECIRDAVQEFARRQK